MTTDPDRDRLEDRLRASLAERARHVEATPALYREVQRRIDADARRPWFLGGVGVVVAVAVVAMVLSIVPSVDGPPPTLDIAETPQVPSAGPSESTTPEVPEASESGLLPSGTTLPTAMALADERRVEIRRADGTLLRSIARDDWTVRGVAAGPSAGVDGGIVAVVADTPAGTIAGVVDPLDGADAGLGFEVPIDGEQVVVGPDGRALAWLAPDGLHVLPLGSDAERVLPIDGPDGLVLQQWVAFADAPSLLATDGRGGAWAIPMSGDRSAAAEPSGPATRLDHDDAAVDDLVVLDTLQRIAAVPSTADADARLLLGTAPLGLPEPLAEADALRLASASDDHVTVVDPVRRVGVLARGSVDGDLTFSELPDGIVAAVALPQATTPEPAPAEAAELGLATDRPLLATDGTAVVELVPDGTQRRRVEIFPNPETDPRLGRIAVRPASTPDNLLLAVEVARETRTSVVWLRLTSDDEVTLLGEQLVGDPDGALSGLEWSRDGRFLAWTARDGQLSVVALDPVDLTRIATPVDAEPLGGGPLVDWVHTGDQPLGRSGHLTFGTVSRPPTRVPFTPVARVGGLDLGAPVVGTGDRLVVDTHAGDSATVGPEVTLDRVGGDWSLRWSADGDQAGELPVPPGLGEGVGDVRLDASGGQVLLHDGTRAWQVTFDGDVVELPSGLADVAVG